MTTAPKRPRRRKKRTRALRVAAPPDSLASDEARFRVAATVAGALGLVLLVAALGLPFVLPRWNQAIGAHGNVALRVAGVAMVIVSVMFRRAFR